MPKTRVVRQAARKTVLGDEQRRSDVTLNVHRHRSRSGRSRRRDRLEEILDRREFLLVLGNQPVKLCFARLERAVFAELLDAVRNELVTELFVVRDDIRSGVSASAKLNLQNQN